jgi:hypothetical protein
MKGGRQAYDKGTRQGTCDGHAWRTREDQIGEGQ